MLEDVVFLSAPGTGWEPCDEVRKAQIYVGSAEEKIAGTEHHRLSMSTDNSPLLAPRSDDMRSVESVVSPFRGWTMLIL